MNKSDYDQDKGCWPKLERIILLFTFLCTVAGTIFAILTSTKALKISGNELRPWISVPRIDTFFHKDLMESKFIITNIGKVPAYLSTDITAEADGKQVNIINEADSPKGPIALMPGQIIKKPAFSMRGAIYQQVVRGGPCPQVYQRILVKYSDDKNDLDRYFVSYRVKFQSNKIPRPIPSESPHTGL